MGDDKETKFQFCTPIKDLQSNLKKIWEGISPFVFRVKSLLKHFGIPVKSGKTQGVHPLQGQIPVEIILDLRSNPENTRELLPFLNLGSNPIKANKKRIRVYPFTSGCHNEA